MAYKTIQYGSSGEDVKKLQTELNKYGYKLDVDGQFGSKTQSAVKDYQKKNNLSVDGIVGKNTWGSLTANSKTASTSKPKQNKSKNTKKQTNRPTYKKVMLLKRRRRSWVIGRKILPGNMTVNIQSRLRGF